MARVEIPVYIIILYAVFCNWRQFNCWHRSGLCQFTLLRSIEVKCWSTNGFRTWFSASIFQLKTTTTEFNRKMNLFYLDIFFLFRFYFHKKKIKNY